MKFCNFFLGLLLLNSCATIQPFNKNSLQKVLKKRDDWNKMEGKQFSMIYQTGSKVSMNSELLFQQTMNGIDKAKAFVGENTNLPITVITNYNGQPKGHQKIDW